MKELFNVIEYLPNRPIPYTKNRGVTMVRTGYVISPKSQSGHLLRILCHYFLYDLQDNDFKLCDDLLSFQCQILHKLFGYIRGNYYV